MTSLKDQMKLLKDAGKGAVEGIYKSITTGTNQLTKLEDMVSQSRSIEQVHQMLLLGIL